VDALLEINSKNINSQMLIEKIIRE